MKNTDSRQAKPVFKQTSFLPDIEFNSIFPTVHTLPHGCLSETQNRQSFKHKAFKQMTGSGSLSALIFKLRGLGRRIVSLEVARLNKDCPFREISRYYLSNKVNSDAVGGAYE